MPLIFYYDHLYFEYQYDWHNVSTCWGMPSNARAERQAWNVLSLRASGRNQSCWHLVDFELLASRTVKE